jgi:hypothetical protein
MPLSRPTFAIWLLSTLMVGLVIALKYFAISIPVVSPVIAGHHFEVLLVSYVLLWAGTVFNGL